MTFSTSVHAAAKDKKAAAELIQVLMTPAAKEQFKARGFTVSPERVLTQ